MKSLLIANRGEIARRIMRTAQRMGIRTVAVYSDADRDALHVREADTAVRIGGAAPRESYLNIAAIIEAAKRSGADAVHPGYGFLAENADFAQAVIDAGLMWIGPSPNVIRQMGDKAEAKRIARAGRCADDAGSATRRRRLAGKIGYPLMIKAVAGGGGRGMRRVARAEDFDAAVNAARSEAEHAFGDGRLMLERAIDERAPHRGAGVRGQARQCPASRRARLLGAAPAPEADRGVALPGGRCGTAREAWRRRGRAGAGCELRRRRHGRVPARRRRPVLFHGNEHAAAGRASGDRSGHRRRSGRMAASRRDGRAVHAGSSPISGFAATPSRRGCAPRIRGISCRSPDGSRCGVQPRACAPIMRWRSGIEIAPHYDSMIAKVIAHGRTRDEAREKLARALDDTVVLGPPTNKAFLAAVLRDEEFAARGATTDFLTRFSYAGREAGQRGARRRRGAACAQRRLRRMEFVEQQSGARDAGALRRGRCCAHLRAWRIPRARARRRDRARSR